MKYQRGGNIFKKIGRSVKKRAKSLGKKVVKGAKRVAVKVAKKAGKSKLIRGIVDKADDIVNSKQVKKIRKKVDSALKKNKLTRGVYKDARKFAEGKLKDSFQGNGHCNKAMMVARRRR